MLCAALIACIALTAQATEQTIFASDHEQVMRLAHAGQLSPKDDCHRHKAAGERHWHLLNTNERGGPCIKDGDRTFYMRNHAVCAAERMDLVRAKEDFWSGMTDFQAIAESLKDCIIGLPSPE